MSFQFIYQICVKINLYFKDLCVSDFIQRYMQVFSHIFIWGMFYFIVPKAHDVPSLRIQNRRNSMYSPIGYMHVFGHVLDLGGHPFWHCGGMMVGPYELLSVPSISELCPFYYNFAMHGAEIHKVCLWPPAKAALFSHAGTTNLHEGIKRRKMRYSSSYAT